LIRQNDQIFQTYLTIAGDDRSKFSQTTDYTETNDNFGNTLRIVKFPMPIKNVEFNHNPLCLIGYTNCVAKGWKMNEMANWFEKRQSPLPTDRAQADV